MVYDFVTYINSVRNLYLKNSSGMYPPIQWKKKDLRFFSSNDIQKFFNSFVISAMSTETRQPGLYPEEEDPLP